jgi:thiamine pyrophosphate-dependent acetolactate synthase large subunit-like protein
MDPAMSLFKWPEFADVANSLGGRGIAVRNHDDLQRAVQAIAERDGPLLIDLKLDPDNVTNDDIVPPAAAAGNRT